MAVEERDKALLADMLGAARDARMLAGGLPFDALMADVRTRLALERALEIIGEAARKVSSATRNANPQIPWTGIDRQDRRAASPLPAERQTMKMHYDEQVDALYLSLDESDVVESEEVKPGIILDFNAAGEVVGIELLDVKRRVPSADLKELRFEVASARGT